MMLVILLVVGVLLLWLGTALRDITAGSPSWSMSWRSRCCYWSPAGFSNCCKNNNGAHRPVIVYLFA